MLAVGTLSRIVSDWPCVESVPVAYAARPEDDTACSCLDALSCASTHCTAVSLDSLFAVHVGPPSFATAAFLTMEAGATAKTYTLPVVPTSCGRNCICPLAFDVVGPMFAVTLSGKIGFCA